MKNRGKIRVVSLFGVIMSLVAISILPDKIPIHFGISGKADSWGSRYFLIFFVIIYAILEGIFELGLTRVQKDIEKEDKDETAQKKKNLIKNLSFTGILTVTILLMTEVVYIIIAYRSGNSNEGLKQSGIVKATIMILSAFMLLLGNYMPKCKRNQFIGIRTRWSLKSNENWNKMQKAGGILLIITGVINLVFACFLNEYVLVIMFLTTITLVLMAVLLFPLFAERRK